MAVNCNSTQQGCHTYSLVVLSDECNTRLEYDVPIPLPTPAKVCIPLKSQLSLDARLNMMMETTAVYSTCSSDMDIEKGKSGARSIEETLGNLKNYQPLTKSLQKQISFDMGGKYMQLLMNHSLMLSKFSTRDKVLAEKVPDAPRSRKYKRAPSFNSRKVVLIFSVLSCLGTMILIYLTLRVRRIRDAYIHSE